MYTNRKGTPSPKKGKKYPHLQRARIGKCLICSKEYRATGDHHNRKQKYCSKTCFQKAWGLEVRPRIIVPGAKKGGDNPSWKGDKAMYDAIHKWVVNALGSKRECEHCHSTKKRKYEWSNKDHKYRRVLGDWQRLCTSCHRRYDIANGIQGDGSRAEFIATHPRPKKRYELETGQKAVKVG